MWRIKTFLLINNYGLDVPIIGKVIIISNVTIIYMFFYLTWQY